MLEGLQISSAEAQREGDKVAKDKAACEADVERIGKEKALAEIDLAKAQPFVDKANKAIASIKPKDIQEIKARGGKVIILTDKEGYNKSKKYCDETILLPKSNVLTAPIIYSIPVQLIAYHLAVILGTDVDQPRNLAKSVTVE